MSQKLIILHTQVFYLKYLLTVHLDNPCNENQPDALFILNYRYFVKQPAHVSGVFIVHYFLLFSLALQPSEGHGVLFHEVLSSHTTHHSP
jgi:hypothetical protein